MSSTLTNVAVGVVIRQQRFFVCRRLSHQHQGGKWEFPGGKVDHGETVEEALRRELKEEIGIDVQRAKPLMDISFSYPDKTVVLHVSIVSDFTGKEHGAEGQENKWVSFAELTQLDFPAANVQIIDKLNSLGYS
ncbi:8-oxo-dGTP diphosphatase MutT [Glaciecola petra]|uniref:8-oxo-dGTP diphosphatase n=1 Tax=Glaciecola petra TaxID=3075602 RepID=A0ABU2ZLJ8_9ALTE|nr:8-oxo-dGTP diphosphatase MutT [Aestuariibacter sp. P117]MDT0593508.1 8-oxo-dGTP diphosphatase MutT [Aestuariibacter sp. P117]